MDTSDELLGLAALVAVLMVALWALKRHTRRAGLDRYIERRSQRSRYVRVPLPSPESDDSDSEPS